MDGKHSNYVAKNENLPQLYFFHKSLNYMEEI
jgi:hypothetical protein